MFRSITGDGVLNRFALARLAPPLLASACLFACTDPGPADDPDRPAADAALDGATAFDADLTDPDAGPLDTPDAAPDDAGPAPDEGLPPFAFEDLAPPPAGAVAAMQAVDAERYAAELAFVARAPRASGVDEHWQATRDRCVEVFLEAGLEVTVQPTAGGGANVIGVLPAVERSPRLNVVAAGYASAPDCAGAAGQATGVAALLEAARVLSTRRYAEPLMFACIDDPADFVTRLDDAILGEPRGIFFSSIGHTDPRPGAQALVDTGRYRERPFDQVLLARERRGDFLLHVGTAEFQRTGIGLSEELRRAIAVDDGVEVLEYHGPFIGDDHRRFAVGPEIAMWENGWRVDLLTDTGPRRNPAFDCLLADDAVERVDLDLALTAVRLAVAAMTDRAQVMDGPPTEGRMVDPGAPLPVERPYCDLPDVGCDDGRVCAPTAGGQLRCVEPPAAPAADGAECDLVDDDCDVGLTCSAYRLSELDRGGRCRPICQSDAECGADEVCHSGVDAGICKPVCDVFGDDCLDGMSCRPRRVGSSGEWTTVCWEDGPGAEGQFGRRCQSGLIADPIVSDVMQLGCLARCRVGGDECGADRVCRRLQRPGLPDDLGLCVPAGFIAP